ncbi:18677_t:CDS:2 [Acaulospora morrowiae]|uniref:18677_t:CDS:1 n=1 Tax=Acaulospora morrowiae TaxID=94023 RepID=A0A9N9BF50_9GLOM|nr:18677_t:CDS:2 [Acaulospora morrowiae]
MQNKASLPPIRFLLDSPIDEGDGYPFPQTPTSPNNTHAYQQRNLPSIKSADTDHLAAINAYNKNIMNFSTKDSYGSCNSLISPPESPGVKMMHQQLPSGSYDSRQEIRHNTLLHPPPPLSLPSSSSRQQCSCCVGPSSVQSVTTSLENNQYFRQDEQYSTFAQTSLPYDCHSPVISHFYPRLSINLLEGMNFDSNSSSRGLCGQTLNESSNGSEKPFVCTEPGCGRKFSVQSNMRRHLRVHRLGRPINEQEARLDQNPERNPSRAIDISSHASV